MYRLFLGRGNGHRATAGARQQEMPCKAAGTQLVIKTFKIGAGDWLNIGINHRGAGALILTVFPAQLMRERNRYVGTFLGQYFSHRQFVGRVSVTMQKANGHRLNPFLLNLLGDSQGVFPVKRGQNLALIIQPFVNFKGQIARYQRLGLAVFEIVHRVPVRSTQLVDIAEAFGGDDSNFGPGAGQHSVDA